MFFRPRQQIIKYSCYLQLNYCALSLSESWGCHQMQLLLIFIWKIEKTVTEPLLTWKSSKCNWTTALPTVSTLKHLIWNNVTQLCWHEMQAVLSDSSLGFHGSWQRKWLSRYSFSQLKNAWPVRAIWIWVYFTCTQNLVLVSLTRDREF